MDHHEAMDDEAALCHYTFNVGDFSRDLAAVTVRVVRGGGKRDVERLWRGALRREYAGVLGYTRARGLEGRAPTPASGARGAADKRHRAKLPQRFQLYCVMRAK